MKKKIEDLTIKEMLNICEESDYCEVCQMERFKGYGGICCTLLLEYHSMKLDNILDEEVEIEKEIR